MANQLTFEERKLLHRLLKEGLSNAEIGQKLGRHRTTIGRELKRNSGQRGYRPKQAQRMAEERREACRQPCKLADPEVYQYVKEHLEKCWSPDQVAKCSRRKFARCKNRSVSHQTIYNWIKSQEPGWSQWLRRRGRPPEKRGRIRDCVSIQGRPRVINRRRRYGDWEGDTIVGKGRRSALVTLVERKSGYTYIAKAKDLKSATTMRAAGRKLKELPASLRRSMTFDNGKEFSEHHKLTRQTGIDVYFAQPYKSWQRGTNENTNGLIRQFFPKGTDFTQISHQAVARVEQLLNERPRKRLDYKSPQQVLAKRLVAFDS
jgi:IS30 family transposase